MNLSISMDTAFSFQALRALSYIPYDGADFGEVINAATSVPVGDLASWHATWLALATRTEDIARRARNRGHDESARTAYLRASNYYRTAEFFLRDDPEHDPRVLDTWAKSVSCFDSAAELAGSSWRRVRIPFADVHLAAYFFQTGSDEPRPTLLACGGLDVTLEELYFFAAAPALRRGWNCLIFDGPGQGSALRQNGLKFRHDWETVVTPAVDYALALPCVDPDRLALIGVSLGGHLAPRAAAFEHRLAACVAVDGNHTVSDALVALSPDGEPPADPIALLDHLIDHRKEQGTHIRWLLSHLLWTFGVTDASGLLTALQKFDLSGVIDKVTCPTLVVESTADHFYAERSRGIYESLTCHKERIVFTAEDGSDAHCQMGALTVAHQRIFDWLDETVAFPQRS